LPGERRVIAGIRPSAIRLNGAGIPARVELIENLGDALLVDLNLDGQIIRARTGTDLGITEGEMVHFSAERPHVHLFDAETRLRIND
jgi:ABC-type sugar transport system ATPase subunit